ncbi:MAG: ribbon-helix-helix domain-containing protein [Candidatus Thermoplasmatota archaeon]
MSSVILPPTLLEEVDGLVATGVFPTREAAIAELLRLGLDVLKARRRSPPFPPRPPTPPGVSDPNDDRPISVDPSDVNWMTRDRFRQP